MEVGRVQSIWKKAVNGSMASKLEGLIYFYDLIHRRGYPRHTL